MALGDQYGETWMMILIVADEDEDNWMYHSMESGKMALGDQYGKKDWMMILLVGDESSNGVADDDKDVFNVTLQQDGLGGPIS